MSQNRLLVVEDESSQRLILQSVLETEFSIEIVESVQLARELISTKSFDLFLLDVMLDDGTGLELARYIRSLENHKATPIVFLTSRQDVDTKIEGFSLGGDDYIVKPVDPKELKARVHAKLRRTRDLVANHEILKFGVFEFNLDAQRISCVTDSAKQEINLTPIEFKLLLCLARKENKALGREEILHHVWGKLTHVTVRSVDTYVAALRRKLGDKSHYIKSVHGVGYTFKVPNVNEMKRAA